MYNFESDYTEGALPEIMNALLETNMEQTAGYGQDAHCEHAISLIRDEIGLNSAIHFLVGGTQANLTVITAALRPHEAAVCAESGHINTHETGAPEATGHKVLTACGEYGKLRPCDIERVWLSHMETHTVLPRMAYISQSTEWGTIYTLSELKALRDCCRAHNMYLFIDGARLGAALTCEGANASLRDIAALCDVFTIGGTKNGALFGEAIVINEPEIDAGFTYIMKQRGGLLAKGRLLGVQFEQLFSDGLYYRAAEHACQCAQRIAKAFKARGVEMYIDSPTNQIFPMLTEKQLSVLNEVSRSMPMDMLPDGRQVVRFAASWATTHAAVDAVTDAINIM